MLPKYPPASSALELTVTVKVDGVVLPAVPVGESHVAPGVTPAGKDKTAEPDALFTPMFWSVGWDPAPAVKVSEVGDTVTLLLAGGVPPLPPPLTTRTTGIVVGLLAALAWVTVTEPL